MSKPTSFVVRALWVLLGLVALGLGALGALLPLLPTTPFVLVAAFAFARSSARLERWLLKHKLFGRLINDWRRYGAIDRRTKIVGIASMGLVLLISVMLDVSVFVLIVQAVVLSASATFVATRPEPPRNRTG